MRLDVNKIFTLSLILSSPLWAFNKDTLEDIKQLEANFADLKKKAVGEKLTGHDFYRLFNSEALTMPLDKGRPQPKLSIEQEEWYTRRQEVDALYDKVILAKQAFLMERTHALMTERMAKLPQVEQDNNELWQKLKKEYEKWVPLKTMLGTTATKEGERRSKMTEEQLKKEGIEKLGSQQLSRNRNNAFQKYFSLLKIMHPGAVDDDSALVDPPEENGFVKYVGKPTLSTIKLIAFVPMSFTGIPAAWYFDRYILGDRTPLTSWSFAAGRTLAANTKRFRNIQVLDGLSNKQAKIPYVPIIKNSNTINLVLPTHINLDDQYFLSAANLPDAILFFNAKEIGRIIDKSGISPMYAKYIAKFPEFVAVGDIKSFSFRAGGDLNPDAKMLQSVKDGVSNIVVNYPQGYLTPETNPISSQFTQKVPGLLQKNGFRVNIIPLVYDVDRLFLNYGEQPAPYALRIMPSMSPGQVNFMSELCKIEKYENFFAIALRHVWYEGMINYPDLSIPEYAARIEKASGMNILSGL